MSIHDKTKITIQYLEILAEMCGYTLKDKFSTRVGVWGIYVHHVTVTIKDIQLKENI